MAFKSLKIVCIAWVEEKFTKKCTVKPKLRMRCCEDYIFTSLRQRSSKSIRVILLALYQYFIPYGTWLPPPSTTKPERSNPFLPPLHSRVGEEEEERRRWWWWQKCNAETTTILCCAATRECLFQCCVVCTYVAAAAQLLVVSLNAAESREKQKCLELSSSLCCIPPLPPTSLLYRIFEERKL